MATEEEMIAFHVSVEAKGLPEQSPTSINEKLGDFEEALEGYSASVSGCPEEPADGLGSFGASLVVEAYDSIQAHQRAFSAVLRAAEKVGLPSWPIVSVEVIEWSEFERRLELPTYPDVVGISEIAEIVGVSRKRASALARSSRFPKPYAELASGPVWFEPMIRRFAGEWDRKPGRPGKITKAEAEALEGVGQEARHWNKEDMSSPMNDLGAPG